MVNSQHASALDVPNQPVTKVGAVVLRCTEQGAPELLVIQPRPKPHTPEDLPPLGLVRGTRAMRLADGTVVDTNHDGRTPPPADAVLEPLHETLTREIEEEAGVTGAMLAGATVTELGPRLFASVRKTPYVIHWFVVELDASAAESLPLTGMRDSLHSQWMGLEEMQAAVAAGRMSPGYAAVAQEALAFTTNN